jgi:hypothetical protein
LPVAMTGRVLAEQRREVLFAREAKERLRREREQTAARDRHLSTLAKRQAAAWRQVEALVITKRPGEYDEAVTLLRDLRDIGERKGRRVEVTERIRALREVHAKKPSFLALEKGGILKGTCLGFEPRCFGQCTRMLAFRGVDCWHLAHRSGCSRNQNSQRLAVRRVAAF